MGGSRNDGFMQRKPVNADIQEAADHDSKYKDYDVWNRIEEKKHREFLSGVCYLPAAGVIVLPSL